MSNWGNSEKSKEIVEKWKPDTKKISEVEYNKSTIDLNYLDSELKTNEQNILKQNIEIKIQNKVTKINKNIKKIQRRNTDKL
jgi:hypothetical protein